jgi:hypothetical protein
MANMCLIRIYMNTVSFHIMLVFNQSYVIQEICQCSKVRITTT